MPEVFLVVLPQALNEFGHLIGSIFECAELLDDGVGLDEPIVLELGILFQHEAQQIAVPVGESQVEAQEGLVYLLGCHLVDAGLQLLLVVLEVGDFLFGAGKLDKSGHIVRPDV